MLYSNHPESLPKNSPKTQNHSFPPRFHWILTQTVTNMKHTKFQLIPIKITALGGGVTVRFTQISLKVCPEIQTHSFPHWFHCTYTQTITNIKRTKFQLFPIKITILGGGGGVRFSGTGPKRQKKMHQKYKSTHFSTFLA